MRTLLFASLLVPMSLCCAAEERAPFRLVSDAEHERFREFLPATEDPTLARIAADPRLIFYTHNEMPLAHQDWSSGLRGIHDPRYNISASQPQEPYGNPNIEFPWSRTAGVPTDSRAKDLKFVRIPPGTHITWKQERLPYDTYGASYTWVYPEGTAFGEILTVPHPRGHDYTFEVRTRTKHSGEWLPNVYRPFADVEEFDAAVSALVPDWKHPQPTPEDVERKRNHHPVVLFNREAVKDVLPTLEPEIVEKLLSRPFKSVLGKVWATVQSDGKTVEGFAPTATTDFHIVPRGYEGHYLEVSKTSCMACHETALKHADEFQSGRDWYGRVRGSDAIFSFHIFDPSCISGNGSALPVSLNQRLIDAGLLKGE
jgi:hypothetical protein